MRERQILGLHDEIGPEWLKIITALRDRLMIGSDTWVNNRWDRYADIMALNRRWLSKLPRSVAGKIAYKNAEELFGRTISMDRVGTQ